MRFLQEIKGAVCPYCNYGGSGGNAISAEIIPNTACEHCGCLTTAAGNCAVFDGDAYHRNMREQTVNRSSPYR